MAFVDIKCLESFLIEGEELSIATEGLGSAVKVYDKVSWHTDSGETLNYMIMKFKVVFDFLKSNNMFTKEGLEVYDLGIDDSASIHSKLINDTGNKFLNKYYDKIINLSPTEIKNKLNKYYKNFK